MGQEFYRFRSIKSLFEYEELEKQSIYFASPEELNDPMEGFRNLFWVGDKIVWKNLFKHYLLCLERACSLLIIGGEEFGKIDIDSLPIYQSYDEFPTPMYKTLFENISVDFFGIVGKLIEKLSTRTIPLRRDELVIYLDAIHFIGIDCIQINYEKDGLLQKSDRAIQYSKEAFEKILDLVDHVETFEKSDEKTKTLYDFLELYRFFKESTFFKHRVDGIIPSETPNRNFVFVDFPEKYLEAIERLLYPEWYTACFMAEGHNSSAWGHYSDSHKGVCLIFEGKGIENEYAISLFGKNGWGKDGPTFGYRNHQFYKISYEEGFGDIDFFKSIGRLPLPKLYTTWYMDGNKVSDVADEIKDEEAWKKHYWENFQRDILKKTKDWEYEYEYRLLLNGLLDDEIEKEHRLLKYDFNSLKGIVFGIKTSTEDKLKIIEIIKNKCKENKRGLFDFYQAYYSLQEKNIQFRKLAFLGSWEINE